MEQTQFTPAENLISVSCIDSLKNCKTIFLQAEDFWVCVFLWHFQEQLTTQLATTSNKNSNKLQITGFVSCLDFWRFFLLIVQAVIKVSEASF